MTEPFHACTIREELNVSREVDRATSIMHPLAMDVFEAAKWRIAREPDCGTPMHDIDESRLVLNLLPNRLAETPGLLVRYFRESRDVVVVDWVHFYRYEESSAVNPAAYVR